MLRMATIGLALLAALAQPARADLTYSFGTEFSGGDNTANNPFASVTIADFAGGVSITATATNLAPTEFIGSLYLNYGTTAADVALLQSALANLTSPQPYSLNIGSNAFKADGDGLYDLRFNFPTSGDRFQQGDVATASFSLFGLSSSMFNNLSAPSGGNGPFIGAMHVQGIAGGGSGWFAPTLVPDVRSVPGPVLGGGLPLLFLGMLGGLTWMQRYTWKLG